MNQDSSSDFSRETLIALCEAAIVPHERWHNRDSRSAHAQLGECFVLLKAGCAFRVKDTPADAPIRTDNKTIWIEITADSFSSFENGTPPRSDTFYIPTKARIEANAGGDWY